MKTIVKQEEGQEVVPAEIIAQSVKKIAEGVGRMKKSGLSERAIVVLLCDASGESRTCIKNVLWSMDQLEKLYLKKKDGGK